MHTNSRITNLGELVSAFVDLVCLTGFIGVCRLLQAYPGRAQGIGVGSGEALT